MSCFALLCTRYAGSEESRFQASKRSNMGSAVLEAGRSADIHEFPFQPAKRSDMEVKTCKGIYMLIVRNGIYRLRKVQISMV